MDSRSKPNALDEDDNNNACDDQCHIAEKTHELSSARAIPAQLLPEVEATDE
jgi:hypothetical protein